jgi:mannose-6-phosphate isomerase-like protein (cupin superfamily)
MRLCKIAGFVVATAWGCHTEKTATIEGPPLLIPSTATMSASAPPVDARFVQVGPAPQTLSIGACQQLFVDVVKGTVTANDEPLAVGDVLAVLGTPEITIRGGGVAVVASARISACDAGQPSAGKSLVRAARAPTLTFMGGAMQAHLDVDDRSVAPSLYLGRLSGLAGVPEHDHAKSWEVLCAVEASGTFILAGQERHLGPLTCVSVPPGVKHSWRPDAGSNLVAVQIYSPPGPEQRFKTLAADEASRDH